MSDLKLPSLNRIQIAGRITRDPELKYTTTNKPTCGFSVAVDDGYGDKKTTHFFNCRAWDKQAERIAGLKKGAAVIVEGRMVNEKYKGRDGTEKNEWKIVVGIVYELEWPERGERERPAGRREIIEAPDDDLPF